MSSRLLFVLLVSTLTVSIFALQRVSFTTFTSQQLQKQFDQMFCSNNTCGNCSKKRQLLSSLSNLQITQDFISKNKIQMTQVSFQVFETTGQYFLYSQGIQNVTTSFALAMPNIQKVFFKGLIAYFHPTQLNKLNGPSAIGHQFKSLAALFCSLGFAVIGIDYIGYGSSRNLVHPYILYPIITVDNMFYALYDAYDIVKNKYLQNKTIDLFTFGYSEGASLALYFSYCWRSVCYKMMSPTVRSMYNLKKTAAADGVYSTSIQSSFLRVDILKNSQTYLIKNAFVTTMAKPAISALTTLSYWAYSSSMKNQSFSSILNSKFFYMMCEGIPEENCQIDGERVNIQQALNSTASDSEIARAIGMAALNKKQDDRRYSSFMQLQQPSHNSIQALIKKQILQSSNFKQTLFDSSLTQIYNLSQYLKQVFLFSLDRDSVVPPIQLSNLKSHLPYATVYSFYNPDYLVCDGKFEVVVDHLRAEIVSSIFVAKYFSSQNSHFKMRAH